MCAFGTRPLALITTSEIARFLCELDAEPGVTPRTVNKHRQLLCSIFKYAMRDDTFKLPVNPALATDKRREPDARPIDFYEPEEVLALARAARAGAHRDPSRPAVSAVEAAERARTDEQDAALFIVAAFTGLRMGELLALRWRHVDFIDAKLLVEASWSGGRLTSPKSRKWRAVPLAGQAAAVLAQLSERRTSSRATSSCSAARSATISIPQRSGAGTAGTRLPPAFAPCASTTCATRSEAL